MLALQPHPDFPSVAVTSIRVDAGRRSGGELVLRFYLEGDLDAVAWPKLIAGGRADGLWLHTCYEAFVGVQDDPGYTEFNYAPSGEWAAYRFDSYRVGMREQADALFWGSWAVGTTQLHFRSRELANYPEWRLGISAVIEAVDGSKSFWALRHPPGAPDFHHTDCFAARVEAPDAA